MWKADFRLFCLLVLCISMVLDFVFGSTLIEEENFSDFRDYRFLSLKFFYWFSRFTVSLSFHDRFSKSRFIVFLELAKRAAGRNHVV